MWSARSIVWRTCISGRASGTFSRNGWEDIMSDGAGASGWAAGGGVDWCEAAELSADDVPLAVCATGHPPWALTGPTPAPATTTAPVSDIGAFCPPWPPKLIAPIPTALSSHMISFIIEAFLTASFFCSRLILLGARVAAWRGPWDSLSMAGSTRSSRSRDSS